MLALQRRTTALGRQRQQRLDTPLQSPHLLLTEHLHRQPHAELRALPRLTLQLDIAAQGLQQLTGDGQAQAGAAIAATGGAVELLERLKNPLMLIGGNANTAVAHPQAQHRQAAVGDTRLNADLQFDLALIGKLQGIGQQVAQNLVQTHTVTEDVLGHVVRHQIEQAQALLFGLRAHAGIQLLEHLAHIQRLQLELHAPGLDLGQVEHVIDQLQQITAGLVHDVGMLDLFGAEVAEGVLFQLIAEDQNAVERRAQLMGHIGEKFRFIAVGQRQLLGLFAQALLGLLARADVDDHRLHQHIVTAAQGRQPHFQRNQPTLAMLAEQLAAAAHLPRLRRPLEALAQANMGVPQGIRQEHFNRLAEHLITGVAKHLLGLAVDHDDHAVAVHQHNGIGRGFDHQAKALLGGLARADVDDHRLYQHILATAQG